jgi:indolepyruvate ferredoxin oxidoreductase
VELAEDKLGDAIYANTIMLGFAWQKGLIPVSARALYRAINLNGVEVESNLQAFEIGRIVAFDPAQRKSAHQVAPSPQTRPLDELIAHRAGELTAYWNAAYGDRYTHRLATVRAIEAPFGSEALTRAVAINLYRLMAVKDEYEVARLYSDGRFAATLKDTFVGGKAKVLLAPPMLSPKDDAGHLKKHAFGGWMLRWGFPTLARLKGLRGGPLDVFGMTAERRAERQLLADYETGLDRMIAELTAERLPLAVKIAAIPEAIRGFGHVKEAAMVAAQADAAKLWAEWDSLLPSPSRGGTVGAADRVGRSEGTH